MKRLLSLTCASMLILLSTACSESAKPEKSSETTSVATTTTSATTTSASEIATTTTTTASTTTAAVTEAPEVPELWDPAIIQRQILLDEGCMCGVALIGYVDGETTADECKEIFYNSVYADSYEFIRDIPDANCINTGFANELYLIFPLDRNASVSVNEWLLTEENDFAGETGQVYYRSDIGAPILLKCNFSDILPNTVVNIVDNEGNTLEWHPSISLKDGSVSRYGVEDKVYDFTINN